VARNGSELAILDVSDTGFGMYPEAHPDPAEIPHQGFPGLTLDETPEVPVTSILPTEDATEATPTLTLAELHGMEVLGSVPVWVLSGLRMHRVGWRHLQSGWVVGVYEIDVSAVDASVADSEGSEFDE
jgi:hypothetical protein